MAKEKKKESTMESFEKMMQTIKDSIDKASYEDLDVMYDITKGLHEIVSGHRTLRMAKDCLEENEKEDDSDSDTYY